VERAKGIIENTRPVEVRLHAANAAGAAVALRP